MIKQRKVTFPWDLPSNATVTLVNPSLRTFHQSPDSFANTSLEITSLE
jgi:hypothetical protein